MFGLFKSKPSNKFKVMGHEVDVVSISRDGKVVFTGDTAKAYHMDHFEGQIFEVLFTTRTGNPYIVYYICPPYYFATVGPAGAAAFGGPFKTEEFRSAVSQQIGVFLVQYLRSARQIDARTDITSFRHNRAHTNVLAFVSSLNDWYAIQHNDVEDDDASERKVAQVNSGRIKITDVIAIDRLSPSGKD